MGHLFVIFSFIIMIGSTIGLPSKESYSPMSDKSKGTIHNIEKRAVSTYECLSKLYIMAFTSGTAHSGSDTGHSVQLRLAKNAARNIPLYDRPGDDMMPNKGDLWKISFSDFHFRDECITINEIKGVSIIENANDGWNIDSISTFVRDLSGGVQVLTQDLDAFRWIDGNGDYSHRRFDLTLA